MSYDTKCYELAEWFLDDEPTALQTEANKVRIAQRIQDNLEDEIECIKQDADDAMEDAKDDYVEDYEAGGEEDDYRFAKDRDEWRHEAVKAQRLK